MSTAITVKLGQLEHDPVVTKGYEKRHEQIDDLLASFPTKGQKQSLAIRTRTDGVAGYWVKAGNRRLATFRKLRDTAGSIRGVPVTNDFDVHAVLEDETDADAFETSRIENLQRLPETPVQEFLAFKTMHETKSVKEIAAIFATTVKRVEQRLALAALHPDVLAMLEAGTITMEAAEAFTIAEPKQQAAYVKEHSGKNADWRFDAHYVKREFEQKLISGTSAVARIIGKSAYLKAGGEVFGEEFNEGGYWTSKKIIDKLLTAHWVVEKAKWKEAGWAFIETADEFAGRELWKIHNARTVGKKATAAEKAKAGVVYWPDGSKAPIVGIFRYNAGGTRIATPKPTSLDSIDHSIKRLLWDGIGTAIAAELSKKPDLVLELLVATLRSSKWGNGSPLDIARGYEHPFERKGTRNELSFEAAFKAVKGKSQKDLLNALVEVIAVGVMVEPPFAKGELAFMERVKLAEVRFDAAAYFKALTKPFLELAWKDMTDPSAGEKAPKGTVDELITKLKKRAKDSGWLPPQIRLPGYTGPHFLDLPKVQPNKKGPKIVKGAANQNDEEEEDDQLVAAE